MTTQAPTCLTFAIEPMPRRGESDPKRFCGIAYSGGAIPQYGLYGDACIDLASMSLPTGKLFALVDHDYTQRAGQFSARIEANQLIVEGELFQSTEAGREVAALMEEGAPWQMSVGIQADADSKEQKRTVTCNGQTLSINTLFKNAVLREVSFVPVGADPNTAVAAFSRNLAGAVAQTVPQTSEKSTMTLEELQAKVESLTEQVTAQTERAESAESQLQAVQLAARQQALTQLAADLDRELSEAETTALTGLNDAVFAVMSATLVSMKPAKQAPAHLFQEQATNGKAEEGKATLANLNAALINQLKGKE